MIIIIALIQTHRPALFQEDMASDQKNQSRAEQRLQALQESAIKARLRVQCSAFLTQWEMEMLPNVANGTSRN